MRRKRVISCCTFSFEKVLNKACKEEKKLNKENKKIKKLESYIMSFWKKWRTYFSMIFIDRFHLLRKSYFILPVFYYLPVIPNIKCDRELASS